jgi:hypothetical protein
LGGGTETAEVGQHTGGNRIIVSRSIIIIITILSKRLGGISGRTVLHF